MTTISNSSHIAPIRGVEQAARLIGAARQPILVVGRIDLAGAAAAVELARQTGAILDHTAACVLRPAQEQGTLGTVPGEAHLRADLVVVLGPLTDRLRADIGFQRLVAARPGGRVIFLDGGADGTNLSDGGGSGNAWERIGFGGTDASADLGVLSALVQGRPVNLDADQLSAALHLCDDLKAARYGVFVFAADEIDPLAQFAAMSLANILSKETRWSVLGLGRPEGQNELIRMAQALTGLPPPLSFAALRPVHDPVVYRSTSVIARRDADLVVWICASERHLPDWAMGVALVAITARCDQMLAAGAQVRIGRPGQDHAGLLDNGATGAIITHPAPGTEPGASGGALPSSAQALAAISDWLIQHNQGSAA